MRYPDIADLYSLFQKHPHVITDSRKCAPNTLFFSLKGGNFDGNVFAPSALEQGCNYAVIDDEKYYAGEKYILVKDCLKTLQELARYHRTQLNIPFIAITGSNGKTTTKELIKSVLSKKYITLATEGNLNNHIGVPLTLLSIHTGVEIAVIEMGANHMGEIALLCSIAQPNYGLITNIGRAHIGEFGSYENIVKAKTEMYQFIQKTKGKIFISADNDLLMTHAADIDKITYGITKNNYCPCEYIEASPYVLVKHDDALMQSHLAGKYNFENIAAAICIGKYFGVDTEKIKDAIENYIPSNNRSQIVKTKSNTLILDAYNANPSSMSAAIENFADMQSDSKWLILGDMLELGEYEIQEHINILQLIHRKKLDNVILVGDKFSKALSATNWSFKNLVLLKNSDELTKKLQDSPINNSLVLIKGSRGIKLEKAVEFL